MLTLSNLEPVLGQRIKRMLRPGLTPQPWSYVARGRRVCVKSGPLRGLEGLVVDNTHQKWLIVSVHLLQRSVAVKVERRQVQLSSFENTQLQFEN